AGFALVTQAAHGAALVHTERAGEQRRLPAPGTAQPEPPPERLADAGNERRSHPRRPAVRHVLPAPLAPATCPAVSGAGASRSSRKRRALRRWSCWRST